MANKNKTKGKRFEQQICDMFKESIGGSWMRVPNSGAFIGQSNAYRIQTMSAQQILLCRGDIIPPEEYDHIMIECKARQDFPFHHLFSSSNDLNTWIDQSLVDFHQTDANVLFVIFKINRKGLYVVTHHDLFKSYITTNVLYYTYNNVVYDIIELTPEFLLSIKEYLLSLKQTK